MELHTPGHSAYTDTLIMYALSEAFRDHLEKVEGREYFYTLVIEDLPFDVLSRMVSGAYQKYEPKLIERFSRLLDEKEIRSLGRELYDVKRLAEYLKELTNPGHSLGEGRFGRGSTFKLPLMPTAGKYLRTDLTLSEKYDSQKPYKVCRLCQALAMLGLALGTLSTRYEGSHIVSTMMFKGREDCLRRKKRKDKGSHIVSTIMFKGEVCGGVVKDLIDDYMQLSTAGSWLRDALGCCSNKLPVRLFGYLTLTALDDRLIVDLRGSDAKWTALVTLFEKVRVVQVRGYSTVELDGILASLADLIDIDKKFNTSSRSRLINVCESLLRVCSVESLEKLFDSLSTRRLSDVYSFARSAYSNLKREGLSLSASELVEALARLCTGV
ncbi:MAG: hypothetical protein RMI04_07765 [Thermofilaceae archaeon]|nr:hypothetical protein [Thermofilaceae archaeon]